MTEKKKFLSSGWPFILPSLIGVCIFNLIPFVDVLRRSFLDATAQSFEGIKNYTAIFQNKAFLLAAMNTLKFIGVCIPLLLAISLLISLVLTRSFKGSRFLKSAFLVPMAIPVASIALIWQVFFNNQGVVNGILFSLHLNTVDWMNTSAAFWILVGCYIWVNLGYSIVLWTAGLSAIPKSLYEAAGVDGANSIQCFFHITLPNMKTMASTITILSVLNSFKSFREAYLVAGDYPSSSIYMLQHLFNNWFRELSLGKLSAAAVVVAAVIFLFILVLQRAWESNDHMGGSKI